MIEQICQESQEEKAEETNDVYVPVSVPEVKDEELKPSEIDEDDEPYCSKGQVCVNDFCYADEDDNEKPDDDIPLKGKFYKIYWGVTAPQDESHTPYIDENRKAVKFNVRLEGDGEVWLYKTKGAIERGVMELENGESDSGLIVKFLKKILFASVY